MARYDRILGHYAIHSIQGDKARRYVDENTGQIISRRRAEEFGSMLAEPTTTRGAAVQHQIADFLWRIGDKPPTRTEVNNSDIMKDLKSGDTSPKGRMHNALVELGFRSEDADYDVGETPE